jgi:hypothetical protein
MPDPYRTPGTVAPYRDLGWKHELLHMLGWQPSEVVQWTGVGVELTGVRCAACLKPGAVLKARTTT